MRWHISAAARSWKVIYYKQSLGKIIHLTVKWEKRNKSQWSETSALDGWCHLISCDERVDFWASLVLSFARQSDRKHWQWHKEMQMQSPLHHHHVIRVTLTCIISATGKVKASLAAAGGYFLFFLFFFASLSLSPFTMTSSVYAINWIPPGACSCKFFLHITNETRERERKRNEWRLGKLLFCWRISVTRIINAALFTMNNRAAPRTLLLIWCDLRSHK